VERPSSARTLGQPPNVQETVAAPAVRTTNYFAPWEKRRRTRQTPPPPSSNCKQETGRSGCPP
jgi:hypothetical protein